MTSRIVFIILGWVGISLAGPTDSVDVKALFAHGNEAYISGDYQAAIDTYSAIEATGQVSPSLMGNLAAAYRAAGDEGSAAWAEQSASALAGERWVLVEAVGIVALAGAVFWRGLSRTGISRRPFRAVIAFALLAVVAGVAGTVINAKRFGGAIVVAPSPLLVSPFEGAEPTTTLTPGDPVVIERHHQGFALVHLPDGTHGWMPDGAVNQIVPTRQ